jgi:Bacteriophage Sf6, terminase small subunit-like
MADGDGAGTRWLPGESLFTPELGAAICARVAAGESLSRLERDAGMPCRKTIRNWARGDADGFGAELMAAMRTAQLARRVTERAAMEAWRARRKLNRRGQPSTYTPELGRAICERLANGESMLAIGRDPGMPCAGTIYGWVNRFPDFQDMYVSARQIQADYLFDEAREVGLETTPHSVWVGRLRFDIIRWQTARLAPRKYCERIVVLQGVQALAAEAAEAAGDGPGGMTVIVKRFSDVTPEEIAEAEAFEARGVRRSG